MHQSIRKMKLFPIILLAFAYANANSVTRYGWTPGQEYIYRFESQVLTGIPDINRSHHSGVKLTAQAKVQAQNDYTLRIKLNDVKFMTLNGEIELNEANRIIENGGPRSGAKEQLPAQFKQALETAIEVHLKNGLVEKFTMDANEHVAVTNIKRSLLSQLQLNVAPSLLHETESNLINAGAPTDVKVPAYSTVEQSLHGRCRTNYRVNTLTNARAMELEQEFAKEERMARLIPSNGTQTGCAGKRYYEVIRTRDLNSCDIRPVYQKVSGADVNIDVGKAHAGNLMAHVDSTRAIICGDLSSFTLRKVVVDDTFVSNPVGYNTEQKLKSSARIMIELLEKKPFSQPLALPSRHFYAKKLDYHYPRHSPVSREVIRESLAVLGTYPILPQPSLSAPGNLLIPIKLDRQVTIPKIVEEITNMAQVLATNPASMRAEEDIAGRVLTVSKYMEIMGLTDLESIWNQAISKCPAADVKSIAKELLLDSMAMVGTNPATMFVLKKVEANEVSAYKSALALQQAIRSIQTPTTELLQQLVNKIKEWKRINTAEKQSLLTSALLQVSNLFYHAYVNPQTMAANYPVRIYGLFGTHNSPVLVKEYIPTLKELLEQARQSQNIHLEMLAITALGKLGHHDAAKILVQVAEGAQQKEPMVRALAVYSMKRTAKRNPAMLINVLMAIINNPQEVAEVRIAALSILPWAQPRYSELQEIAVRSWIEPSKQVASFARSMLTSLQFTAEPELKPIAQKVRTILRLLQPTQYGLQFSKHFDLSNFVEYLLASVSSRASIVNSRTELVPARIETSTDLYLEALGEGLKLRTHSFKLYSQGFERVIDEILEQYTNYKVSSPETQAEINKIAQLVNLKKRIAPQQMAFVQHNLMGFEYASLLRMNDVKNALQRIKQAFVSGEMKGRYACARNLVSLKVFGMNEAGFPIIGAIDHVTIFAASASYEKQGSDGATVAVTPAFISKIQADLTLISPFTNEAVTTGVSVFNQAILPLEGKAAWKKGEVELSLMMPKDAKQSGSNVEILTLRVVPFTARKNIDTIKPMSLAQDLKKIVSGQPLKKFQKEFQGQSLIHSNIQAECDNTYVDFYSYWEKLRQHNIPSLLNVGPLESSVRYASVKVAIQPHSSQLNEMNLKLKLWARQTAYDQIANPIDTNLLKTIKSLGMESVHQSLEILNEAPASPATVIKVEASLKGQSSNIDSVQAFATVGAKLASQWQIKPIVAASAKVAQSQAPVSFSLSGNLYLEKFKARWNLEELMQQSPELSLNARASYGIEGQQEKMSLHVKSARTEKLIQSLRASPEFKRCQQLIRQERQVSPLCSMVRQQVGSFDTAEVKLTVPQAIYKSEVVKMIGRLFKAQFWANYRPIIPIPHHSVGKLNMVFNVARAGNVANIKVEHSGDAYELRQVRIPYAIQGFFPISARVNALDWLQQKATLNMAPATCRVEPRHITSFDNVTYSYNIPECEHVLMMDGTLTYPVAVLAQKQSGQEMIVKVIAGKDQIQIGSKSRGIELLVNNRHVTIRPGQKIEQYSQESGYPTGKRLVATVRRYTSEEVYHVSVQQYGLKVVTDGKSVELISPQLFRNRAVGLCGNLDLESVACVQSPGQCIMRPNLAAMSYMTTRNMIKANAQCSVQAKFPREFPEYNKELQACVKEEFVPTHITPIFQKAVSGNGVFELGLGGGMVHGGRMNSEVSGGAGYGNLQGGLGCVPRGGLCRRDCSNCCSRKCRNASYIGLLTTTKCV